MTRKNCLNWKHSLKFLIKPWEWYVNLYMQAHTTSFRVWWQTLWIFPSSFTFLLLCPQLFEPTLYIFELVGHWHPSAICSEVEWVRTPTRHTSFDSYRQATIVLSINTLPDAWWLKAPVLHQEEGVEFEGSNGKWHPGENVKWWTLQRLWCSG